MKFLYMAPVYIETDKPDGVAKKVLNHYHVFGQRYDSWIGYYGKDGVVIRHGEQTKIMPYGNAHRRFALYSSLGKLVEKEKFDAIYIRYPKSENSFIQLLKRMKNTGAKIVIEIPTYPYNGKSFRSVKTALIACVDYGYRTQLKKYVDRIVTYSDDDVIFGIKTIRTINGIVYDRVKLREYTPKKEKINMIAVATIWSCHGFDRIISGMEEYYRNGGKEEIRFNIVGNGPYAENYRKLLENCSFVGNRVVLWGFQTGDVLDSLYNNANIAVNSLALHRMGLTKESTLKTKEYAAKGLPMISSYEVDAFDEAGNEKYVMRVEDSEDPVSVESIIDFYNRIYSESIESVSEEIRLASKKVCDMDVTLQGVMDYFEKK